MAFTLADITNEIRVVIGDLADQFNSTTGLLKIENELKNTIQYLTVNHTFLWNTRETNLPHTSGIITCPSNMARVIFLSDSEKNEKYFAGPYESYSMIKRNVDRAITWTVDTEIPYFLMVDPTTGAETIAVGTMDSTVSTRTFNLVYTEYTDDVTTVWIPSRVRPFIVSETASNLLVKMDSPDMQLVIAHQQIATANLNRELDFNNSRSISRINYSMTRGINTRVGLNSNSSI